MVDPPMVNWDLARSLQLDHKKMTDALSHPSRWIVFLAAKLLKNALTPPELEAVVRQLFEGGRGHALWAGGALAAGLDQQRVLALVCDRLSKPPVRGCEHLFRLLRRLNLLWGDEISDIVKSGLMGDVDIALDAAQLACDIAKPGQLDLAAILDDALVYWIEHEEPYPTKGGLIPHSPRADIIAALMKIRLPSYADLRSYIADQRSDVKDIGAGKLMQWLGLPDGPRALFLSDIGEGRMPPNLLGKALDTGIPLDPDELSLAVILLDSRNANTRFSAMSLLHQNYLDPSQIRAHAQRMTRDDEQQIRDRAYRILDTLGGDDQLPCHCSKCPASSI